MPQKEHQSFMVPKFLFGLYRIAPRAMLLFASSQVAFAILTSTIAPLFVSRLLLNISHGSATIVSSVGLLIGYATMLFLGDVVAMRLSIFMAYRTENKMQVTVARRVLEHLQARSLGYHSNRMTGGTVSDTQKLNGSIERFWDTMMFTALPIVTTILATTITLSFMIWQYALILFVLSVIIAIVIIRAQSTIAPASKFVSEKTSAITAHIADVIGNVAAVKAFAREKDESKTFTQLTNNWRDANQNEMKKVLVMTGSFSVLMMILNVAAFMAAILATQDHLAGVSVIYLMISYTLSVVSQLWSVSGLTRNYIRVIGDAGPMVATLAESVEIFDGDGAHELTVTKGKIAFQKVNFTHDENNHPLFEDFSLTIKPGERVGLVGHSGSGKTSLTRLLLRFSDIDGGEITIDGQNIATVTQDSLHQAIAYVPQEPMLFHRSLRENIAYGKPDATDEEVMEAAKAAYADEFITLLPKGLDTVVGERGVKLSGGQRQRVAIARALLKDAPILVLDEATSALDSESERLIQASLETLMKNRTSIVIAHRLSTIAKLDRIIVLDNGKIAEDGTHAELLAEKGVYAKLWAHQSGGFIEE